METEFTPWMSLAGGMLIGVASVLLMYTTGRIAGVSGALSRLLPPNANFSLPDSSTGFVGGLFLSAILYMVFFGFPEQAMTSNWALLAGAGLLVGVGTVVGNGCTSGHGVCGISRLSVRSIIATLTFVGVAAVTVFILRHVIGA